MEFTARAIKKISDVLQAEAKRRGDCYRMVLDHTESGRKLSLEIYPNHRIGKKNGNLISVYTSSAHLQLHFCTGYVVSKALGEVTFVAENGGKVCGLIIEKEAGCSLFANVEAAVLSGDFTALGPEVMLSGIALSLTESMLAGRKKTPAPASSKNSIKPSNKRRGGRTRA